MKSAVGLAAGGLAARGVVARSVLVSSSDADPVAVQPDVLSPFEDNAGNAYSTKDGIVG